MCTDHVCSCLVTSAAWEWINQSCDDRYLKYQFATYQHVTVRATLPSALNVINASSVGKLVQLVTASRLTLYHEGQIDPMKDECHYQVKH